MELEKWMIKSKDFIYWHENSLYHRTDGPAIMNKLTGSHTWYVRGKVIISYEHLQKMTGCTDADIITFKLKYGEIKS